MSEDTHNFDAGAYWRDRVVSGSDLDVVGHRSMGQIYNSRIYQRRIEVLGKLLDGISSKPLEELAILDIGCGSGFYTEYWSARGVRNYVGVDISPCTIAHLADRFPNYEFVNSDITGETLDESLGSRCFDIVTIFDVFYHIVDDAKFENAVKHAGARTADSGIVLVMDQLCRRRYQLSEHVVYRQRDDYLAQFAQAGMTLVESELLFHFLVPPLSGIRVVDIAMAGLFKSAGLLARISDRFAAGMANCLRGVDARLRTAGRKVSNSEIFVFQKSKA